MLADHFCSWLIRQAQWNSDGKGWRVRQKKKEASEINSRSNMPLKILKQDKIFRLNAVIEEKKTAHPRGKQSLPFTAI